MLVHQVVSRTQALIENPEYWTSARIIPMINQCKDSISTHFGLIANGYALMESVVSQRSYALPLDFLALKLLYWGSGYRLTPDHKVNSTVDILRYTSTPSETGVPSKYYLWGKEDHQELWVWPTFDAVYEVEFWYYRTIPDVVNNNDEPMIPRDLHNQIVEYCRRQTWVEDELHNYTPERFDMWWENELMKMQISKNQQLASSDNISPANFDDVMPDVDDGTVGFPFSINSHDGVIW